MLQPTSIVSSAEATEKRSLARASAAEAGYETLVATTPATVRWLLCGRGRPVANSSPTADYTVVLAPDNDVVLVPDIEASRVESEERFEEIGYQPLTFPWHEGPGALLDDLLDGRISLCDLELEASIAPIRRHLAPDELDRYRAGGKDVAAAMVESICALAPDMTEREVAADIAARLQARGFFPPIVLVAGEERQPLHSPALTMLTRRTVSPGSGADIIRVV